MCWQYPVRNGTVGDNVDRTIVRGKNFFSDLIGGMVMQAPVHTGYTLNGCQDLSNIMANQQNRNLIIYLF
jgi:hypothetical protein